MSTGHRPAAGGPSPQLVFDTLFAYQRTEALRAAIELDLFRAIGEGAGETAAIARRCAASERGIRILCDFLTIGGFLSKSANAYTLTPTAATFLDPRSPACVASTARFLGNPMIRQPLEHLAEVVRRGHSILPGQGSVEPENPAWVEFAHSMAPMMAPMAAPLGTIALDGKSGPVSVLDIAAGHGLFGIEVAKQNPKARVVAVDWAAVLAVAEANAQRAGVGERYHGRPGSAFDVDYGGPHDIALVTNFLHHFDRLTCVRLLTRVHAALRPGGRAAALEFVPNDDRVSPPMSAAFSLTMLATTQSGDAYTFRELAEMFREAGFADMTAHPLPTGPHTVVVGRAV
jgi:SAM-dependent methyltransferase